MRHRGYLGLCSTGDHGNAQISSWVIAECLGHGIERFCSLACSILVLLAWLYSALAGEPPVAPGAVDFSQSLIVAMQSHGHGTRQLSMFRG